MCPPKRPSAFIGSSRLTRACRCIRENEVRAQVSGARSAQNDFGFMSSAVRQTPLTATLSPVFNSPGVFRASTLSRRFSPRCSMLITLPTSSMIPVNINVDVLSCLGLCGDGALPRPSGIWIAQITFHREVFSEAVQCGALHALGLPVQTRSCNEGYCPLAENRRSIVEKHLIDLARG